MNHVKSKPLSVVDVALVLGVLAAPFLIGLLPVVYTWWRRMIVDLGADELPSGVISAIMSGLIGMMIAFAGCASVIVFVERRGWGMFY